MQASGWVFRAQSAVAAGTTSLTITKPSGTADGDIMLMWLTHKGAAYATVPAGWTLIQQNLSGSTRGELYWKRASSEGANYSITGLADTALGMIASYIGGLASGNVVDVSNSIANASGVYTTPQVTPTVKNTLIVASIHAGGNVSIGTRGTTASIGQGNFFSNFGEWDEQLGTMRTLTDTGTNNGTDCRLQVSDAGKPIPDITGTLGCASAFARESVWITAALICETAQLSAGTRFYLANGVTFTRINDALAGDWDSDAYGPAKRGAGTLTQQLIQNKIEGFHLANGSWVTNRQGNYDECIARLVTKPLAAQTIAGTINFIQPISVRWIDDIIGPTNSTVARYKVHVYIAVGQTGVVRAVLLDNFVDSVDLNNTSTVKWQALSSGQTLTPGDAEDGDTLIVELGVRIVSSPTPAPNYPPTEYSRLTMTNATGCTLAGNNTSCCVGAQDGVSGSSTITDRCAFIDFSQTIVEAPPASPPPNSDFASATVIPSTLPYQLVGLDCSAAPSNARTVWFKWTAPQSGNVNVFTNGSNYEVIPLELTGTPGSFTAINDYFNYDSAGQRGLSISSFDAVMGTTYYIVFYLRSFSNATAGELWITMTYTDVVAAEGDLYIPNNEVYVYRNGLPINWVATGALPAGCTIDYSQLPLIDMEDGSINTSFRFLYTLFGGTPLVEIIECGTLSRGRSEIDFLFETYTLLGPTASRPDNGAALAMDRQNALVIECNWGNGFLDVNDLGTTGSLAAFFDSVSNAAARSGVYRCSIQNGDNTGSPVVVATGFTNLTADSTCGWYGAVSDTDGGILYYVSAGFYITPRVPSLAYHIRAYNFATLTNLGIIATVTCTGPAAASGPHGLCVAGDGSLFVCTGSTIQRFSAAGVLLNTYTAIGEFADDGNSLWDCHIHPDGTTLIAIDGETMTVFEWNISSGVQTNRFQTWLSQGNFTQFAIYQPSPLPPPGCPGDIDGTLTDGLPYTPVPTTPCGGTGTRSGNLTGA